MRRVLPVALLAFFFVYAARAEPTLRESIDSEVSAAWKREKLTPAAPADDATFLRRLYLDLVGTVPTADEATKFLADTSKDKRDKLIDKLLADPRCAAHLAQVWDLAMFGRNPPEDVRRRDEFRKWLTGKFEKKARYDDLVKQLLLGEQEGSEAFLAQYRYRVDDATEAVSRLFLGTQLQCARCHDHPFEELKQQDFYGMAGFLVRIVVFDKPGKGQGKQFTIAEKASGDVLFSGSAKDARPGKKGDPIKPKFLGGKTLDEPPLPKDFKEADYRTAKTLPKPPFSRKAKLAEWVTAKDNPYFARAAVNRVWGQFMGRGLVHPIDDLSSKNTPILPALLERLTKDFVAHEYDLKWLIKEVVSSQTYQLGAKGESKDALPTWYERARVRPLSAEEMLATMRVVTAFDASGGNIKNSAAEAYFLRYFGQPTNGQGEFQGGLQEHLFLNNSPDVAAFVRRRTGNLADEIATSNDSLEKRVDRLFLAVLTRPPTAKEREKFAAHLKTDDKRKLDGLIEEAIWALLNTAEFRFNR